jgi:hypothetical protein
MDVWPAGLSATILATLGVILAGSLAVFSILGRRVTRRHQELALRQWAAGHEAVVTEEPGASAPPGLEFLGPYHPASRQVVHGPRWTLAELTTDPPAEAKGKTPRWRLLAFRTASDWPPTGLRPVAHPVSLLDLVGVGSFPSLGVGDQFVVFGAEASAPWAAAALAGSAAPAILPPDIGLLVAGGVLVLDFSHRRFEPREFDGLISLAAQLAAELAEKGSRVQGFKGSRV